MKVYSQVECRHIVEYNIELVELGYPNLRKTNRREWNHKVAYLSYLKTKQVGQKSRDNNAQVSEDTIGIVSAPINQPPGSKFYPQVFEAVDLVNGTSGELQWLSYGMVTQCFIIPTVADVSQIPDEVPVPIPPSQPCKFPSYSELGDDAFWRDNVGKPLEADYKEFNQVMNDGSIVWSSQTMYDAMYWIVVDKMEPKAAVDRSVNKHRLEWRAALAETAGR